MSKSTKYIITSSPFIPDILSGILWQLDINGVNEDEQSISVFVTDASDVDENIIRGQLDRIISQNLIQSYSIEKEEIEDKNWNEIWEMSREVIRVSDRIIIRPSFKTYDQKENEIVLTIDPKMSFGTGEHESTKLVLQLLEGYVQKGDNILDVGSGTGVLAIAAIKLGADSAVAVDNDQLCYENCFENCSINDVVGKVEITEGVIDGIIKTDFDLIVANIQKNILLDISDQIKQRVKVGGRVILSGLMLNNEKEIKLRYQSLGFKQIEIKYLNEWLAIVFKKE